MNLKILLILPLILIVIAVAVLAGTTDTVTISVNVSTVTDIDVVQTALYWNSTEAVTPGTEGAEKNLTLENVGSTNINNVQAKVDTESSNPLGLTASSYEAGSFLVIHNSTSSTYYFVDRREWNLTTSADVPAGAIFESGAIAWGWHRNTSYDYLWSLKNATEINATHGCNSTGTSFRISTSADDGTNRDISSATACGNLQTGDGYSTCYYSAGPLNGYCVLMNQSCDFIQIYRYDYNSAYPTCAARVYLRETSLAPGSSEDMKAKVWVPYGVPAGDTSDSTLTITVSAA